MYGCCFCARMAGCHAAASCGWRRHDPQPAAPSLSTGSNVVAPQALAGEVAAQVAIEGGPAGGALRMARPGALGDVWKALEIAELLPAQLQVRRTLRPMVVHVCCCKYAVMV